jgi:hypothetical protein
MRRTAFLFGGFFLLPIHSASSSTAVREKVCATIDLTGVQTSKPMFRESEQKIERSKAISIDAVAETLHSQFRSCLEHLLLKNRSL